MVGWVLVFGTLAPPPIPPPKYKITNSQDVRVFWKVPKTGVTRSPVSSKVMMKTVHKKKAMVWELWDLVILIIENSTKSKIKKIEGNLNFTQMYILYISLQKLCCNLCSTTLATLVFH